MQRRGLGLVLGVEVGVGARVGGGVGARVSSLRFPRTTDGTFGCVILIDHLDYAPSSGEDPALGSYKSLSIVDRASSHSTSVQETAPACFLNVATFLLHLSYKQATCEFGASCYTSR